MLDGSRLHVERRRQPLRVSPTTPLIAVTRLEHRPQGTSAGNPSATDAATLIARTTLLPRVKGVQVDYDATVSERPFYQAVLDSLRNQLGPAVPISNTALASWCVGDRWLEDLPIDEAVPMLFRMGPTNSPFVAIAATPRSASRACRSAVGVSLDERLALDPAGRRVYVFSPRVWTAAHLAAAAEIRR